MALLVYTDGSCSLYRGGWGAVIVQGDSIIYKIYGYIRDKTTSNRVELLSIIQSYIFLFNKSLCLQDLIFYTDSTYVQKGVSYLDKWIQSGWKISSGQDVKNRDIWEKISCIKKQLGSFKIEWIKGHKNNIFNIEADRLARKGVQKCISINNIFSKQNVVPIEY
jgi:ribonuclease HI